MMDGFGVAVLHGAVSIAQALCSLAKTQVCPDVMFSSREGLGLRGGGQIAGTHDRPAAPAQQLRFALQTAQRPAFASLSASFGNIFQNLPWNQREPAADGSGAQTEPKTSTFFEERFCQRGNSKCGSLAGVG